MSNTIMEDKNAIYRMYGNPTRGTEKHSRMMLDIKNWQNIGLHLSQFKKPIRDITIVALVEETTVSEVTIIVPSYTLAVDIEDLIQEALGQEDTTKEEFRSECKITDVKVL